MSFKINSTEQVTIGTTSQTLFSNNGNRIHFSLENKGSSSVFIRFGESPATTSTGHEILPGQLYEPYNPGRGAIQAISESGDNICIVTEG